ncbi:MAG: DUF2505 domain-containing protein [Actinomycetaceae bacterium]|nr:DUF2505 domain-containing protein [Actinomycetaceae bacterium]
MKFHTSVTYPADLSSVKRMLQDEDFYRRRLEKAPVQVEGVDVRASDGQVQATSSFVARVDELEIPAGAKRFLPDSGLQISVVETWNTADNTGKIVFNAKGLPVSMSATCVLIEEGNKVRRDTDGDLTVSVPLLGRKIETAAIGNISKVVELEEEIARRYFNNELGK